MNTVRLRAWAAAVGWNPEKQGPVDEANDRALQAFVAAHRGKYETRRYYINALTYPFAEMVEVNPEDFGFLAWISVADVGDTYDAHHSERVKRVR